jgi:ParB-like chromosome segregation protein Spo0J
MRALMTESTKKISRLLLGGITIGPNPLRPLVDAEVKRLAASMQQIGMMTPITVRFFENVPSAVFDDSYEIVAGRHRFAAAQSLGWEEIDAVEIECSDIDAKLWEIAENLYRAELTKLQHDEQVAMWIRLTNEKEVSAQVAPKPKGGRPAGGVRAAARDLGIDRDAASRAIKVASLSDEAKEAAREHGLDDNRTALLEAARETEPAAQVAKIIERATRTPTPSAEVRVCCPDCLGSGVIECSDIDDSGDAQAEPIGTGARYAGQGWREGKTPEEIAKLEALRKDEDWPDTVGDALEVMMRIDTVDAWLVAFPGPALRSFSNHMQMLVAELDARVLHEQPKAK